MRKLAAVVLAALLLSGCHRTICHADCTDIIACYDLTSVTAVHLEGSFHSTGQRIRTDSSVVSVWNRGQETVRIILYDLADPQAPAMQRELLPGKTSRFTGLIPQAFYGFSLAVSKDRPVNLVLFD